MSARAAWRLISLGFRRVFRYTAGKKDWLANGLPAEGQESRIQRAGDLARRDAPTCLLAERLAEVKARLQRAGWDTCAVVNQERIVLGLLRPEALAGDPQQAAEQAMESGPRTYRLNSPLEKIAEYLRKRGEDSVLVTTSNGEFFGLLKREDVERALSG
jgi:hypothetical protein